MCARMCFTYDADVFDTVEYLSSLGKAQTANVKRDAAVGVAQANRDAGIRVNISCSQCWTFLTRQVHQLHVYAGGVLDSLLMSDRLLTEPFGLLMNAWIIKASVQHVFLPVGLVIHRLAERKILNSMILIEIQTIMLIQRCIYYSHFE